ncbi:MAG TPA: ABC transporter ATP-binding protein [Actinomycetota bacterium]|nr:ABC transporter ATP-binding protein [Actinomycetota bacterium]
MAASENIVELEGVRRSFSETVALSDLSFCVERGTVTVLLGPNGAGKTTALRMVTGALAPEDGTIRVFGLDPASDGEEVRARCGVVPATPAFYERLTGRDNLEFAARMYGLDSNASIDAAAERFGIDYALDSSARSYSTGMKTRLALARAVLHDPELLLLDEPTAGLDPESARAVLRLIDEVASGGKTVLMSTHLLLEAEGLADQVVMIDGGRTLVSGAPLDLIQEYWPTPTLILDALDRSLLAQVTELDGVSGITVNGGPVTVALDDIARVPEVIAQLVGRGVSLTRAVPHEATLEELYFVVRGSTVTT